MSVDQLIINVEEYIVSDIYVLDAATTKLPVDFAGFQCRNPFHVHVGGPGVSSHKRKSCKNNNRTYLPQFAVFDKQLLFMLAMWCCRC